MLQTYIVFVCNSSRKMACPEFVAMLKGYQGVSVASDMSGICTNTMLKTCLTHDQTSGFAAMLKTSQEFPSATNECLNFSRWYLLRKEANTPCCKRA